MATNNPLAQDLIKYFASKEFIEKHGANVAWVIVNKIRLMCEENNYECVRTGYWKPYLNSDGNLNHYECSVCKQQQGYTSRYCEECGSRMYMECEQDEI